MVRVLALVVILGALATSTGLSGRPSAASEQSACDFVQDLFDDLGAAAKLEVVEADLRAAGRAANRGESLALARAIAAARVAMSEFRSDVENRIAVLNRELTEDEIATRWKPTRRKLHRVTVECRRVGRPIRS